MSNSKAIQTSWMESHGGISQERVVLKGAHDLRLNGILVDVVLVVNEVKLAPCHKFMLASSSPYFRAMFSHGMVEQDKKEIDIMGVERESLRLVLDYIYTAQVPITDHNVQGLMSACSLLQITTLYAKCRDYMIQRLDVSNCVSVYQFARSMYCPKLEDAAFKFMAKRFKDIVSGTEFATLSKEELIDLISSDDLWITEEQIVYEAVIQWLTADVVGRSRHIAEVFAYIRFALMDEDFLEHCVMQEELIFEHRQLQVQVEAAKEYISHSSTHKEEEEAVLESSSDDKSDPEDESNSTTQPQFPFYTVCMIGSEDAIKIPLSVQPRAGINTKEFILFTNGRKTFVLNPDSASEYYGFVEGKSTQPTDGEVTSSTNNNPGYSPDIPIMKNPEAHVTANGTTYLLGGLEIEKMSPPNVRTRVYSLEQDDLTWSQCTSMPLPRCMAAYGDGCGHLYVLGGKALSQGEVVSTVHKYSRIENEWEEVVPMPIAVYGHGSASLKNKIYVIGGKTTAKVLLANVHFLDCVSHQWTEIESITVPRFLHGVTVNRENDDIYVLGGSSEDGVLNSVEVFNTSDSEKRWRFGESFPGNRCAQFAMFFQGQLHAVGGYVTERSDAGRYESREMHDIFVLDTETGQWRRKIRRVKGTTACSMACVKVSLNMTKVPRAKTILD